MSASSPPLELRPLGLGELLDRTAALWRQNLWPLFALTFALQLITWGASKLFVNEMAAFLEALEGTSDLPSVARIASLFGWMSFLAIAYWWMANAASLACAHFMLARALGAPSTLGAAFKRLRQRFLTLSGVLFLSLFYGAGYLLAAGVPATLFGAVALGVLMAVGGSGPMTVLLVFPVVLLSFLGMAAGMLFWVLRFMLAAQVIAAEEGGVRHALRRSGQLLSGRVGQGFINLVKVRATIVATVMYVLILAVSTTAQIPVFILQRLFQAEDDPFGLRLELVPRVLMTLAELAGVAAQALFSPLSIVLATLFYVDMRVRREGWDLELALERQAVDPR